MASNGEITISGPTIRIHLLGAFQARRADGSAVSNQAWGSGKTMDLMRYLALANGRPVRVASIVEDLWPVVAESKALGSLRTSASMVRRILAGNCIRRSPGAMFLAECWVDVDDFRAASQEVQVAVRSRDPSRVLVLVEDAELVYQGDFRAHADDSHWAVRERTDLRGVRHEMLTDAATSAIELHRFREAVGFATTAVGIDTSSESAHRSLIRAHAELGDVRRSLDVYESYRSHLAEDFGADPSSQAQDLHLSVLRGRFN